jgi:hypothetical protein
MTVGVTDYDCTCPGYFNHPVDILGFSMQILSEIGSVY